MLTSLSIVQNNLGNKGASYILKNAQYLQRLDLSDNHLDHAIAQPVFDLLIASENLLHLNLDRNHLGHGIDKICEGRVLK